MWGLSIYLPTCIKNAGTMEKDPIVNCTVPSARRCPREADKNLVLCSSNYGSNRWGRGQIRGPMSPPCRAEKALPRMLAITRRLHSMACCCCQESMLDAQSNLLIPYINDLRQIYSKSEILHSDGFVLRVSHRSSWHGSRRDKSLPDSLSSDRVPLTRGIQSLMVVLCTVSHLGVVTEQCMLRK